MLSQKPQNVETMKKNYVSFLICGAKFSFVLLKKILRFIYYKILRIGNSSFHPPYPIPPPPLSKIKKLEEFFYMLRNI